MATSSFQTDVVIKNKKIIKQIQKDLKSPTFNLSNIPNYPSSEMPANANEVWFKNSVK